MNTVSVTRLQPNTTQVPNIILDEWLPTLTGAEFHVLMILVRKTYGWHKDSDSVSYSQLMEKTGLSNGSVANALKALKEKGYVVKGEDAPGKVASYKINLTPPETGVLQKLESTTLKTGEVTSPKTGDTKETKLNKLLTKETTLSYSSLSPKNQRALGTNPRALGDNPRANPQKLYSNLEDITETDLEEISRLYKVPLLTVKLSREKMDNWLHAKGKTYKNYKRALMNWVLRDAERFVERSMGDPTKRAVDARNL